MSKRPPAFQEASTGSQMKCDKCTGASHVAIAHESTINPPCTTFYGLKAHLTPFSNLHIEQRCVQEEKRQWGTSPRHH